MTTYEQYGVCHFSLYSQGYTTCGDACEVTSGSVKVDQKKDTGPIKWGDSSPAPYAKPLGTDTSGAVQGVCAVGWAILVSFAVLTIRCS